MNAVERLAAALRRTGEPFLILGGAAVEAHGGRRFVSEAEALLSRIGAAKFDQRLWRGGYEREGRTPLRWRDRVDGTPVVLRRTDLKPGRPGHRAPFG
jgi:hypothetical protein